jgi:hypothetical protein
MRIRDILGETIHITGWFVSGDSKYKVPPLSPLEIKESIVRDRRMTLTLRDIKIYGLLGAEVEDIK